MRVSKASTRGRGTNGRQRVRGRKAPTERDYQKAFMAWKAGEHIADIASRLGVRRGSVRHYLTKLAGGPEEFKAMRAGGAGGLRPSLGERAASPRYDRGAKVLRVGQRRNWKYRSMKVADSEVSIPVFVAPTRGRGTQEFIPAGAREKADVIAEMGNGLPPARLVRLIRDGAEA